MISQEANTSTLLRDKASSLTGTNSRFDTALFGNRGRFPIDIPVEKQAQIITPQSRLISEHEGVSNVLLDFLKKINLKHDGTPDGIYKAVEKCFWKDFEFLRSDKMPAGWLRGPGADIMPLLDKMNFIQEVRAPGLKYGDALLMGGPIEWVRDRLSFLSAEYERGVRFNRLVMLGADRPLDLKDTESISQLIADDVPNLPRREGWKFDRKLPYKDEFDMMQRVYEQSKISEKWRNIETVWIRAEYDPITKRNASTGDTVHLYIDKYTPDKAPVLVASSQPHVCYQTLVAAGVYAMRGVEADSFAGIGRARLNVRVVAYLDQIVRRLGWERSLDNNS